MMELDIRTLKRIKNLSNFCDFDLKKGIATIFLNFNSVDEILEINRSINGKVIIKDDAVGLIYYWINMIPKVFNVNYSIFIKDLNGYDSKEVVECFEKAIKNIKVKNTKKLNTKKILMIVFIIIGLIFLFGLKIYSNYNNINIRPVFQVIIVTMIDLCFEIYFEEGAMFFTIGSLYRKYDSINKKRFLGITIRNFEN